MEIQKGKDGYKSYKMATRKKQKGLSTDNPLEVPSGLPRIQNDIENELIIQIFQKD